MMDTKSEVSLHTALEAWQHAVPTEILHHDAMCCVDAKEWFLAMDASETGSNSLLQPPVWICERYVWGPAKWPMHWCEVVAAKTLECGALAALARASYARRGTRVFPVQIVRIENHSTVAHWAIRWEKAGFNADWIKGTYVFHETVGVVAGWRDLRIWDPTENHSVEASARGKEGGVAALRVVAGITDWPRVLSWEGDIINVNTWYVFEDART
jgi:hypothetical protein